jgi:hypothetical protein
VTAHGSEFVGALPLASGDSFTAGLTSHHSRIGASWKF